MISSPGGGCPSPVSAVHGQEPLEAALASLVAALVRREVAAVLGSLEASRRDGEAAGEPEWLSQADAGRRAGVTPQTIRGWQADGRLTKGRRGRVHLEELRTFLGKRDDQVEHPAHRDELRQERARRAAREILEAKACRAGGRDGR